MIPINNMVLKKRRKRETGQKKGERNTHSTEKRRKRVEKGRD